MRYSLVPRARAAFKLTVAGRVDLGRRENGFGTEGTGDVIGVGGNCALAASCSSSAMPNPSRATFWARLVHSSSLRSAPHVMGKAGSQCLCRWPSVHSKSKLQGTNPRTEPLTAQVCTVLSMDNTRSRTEVAQSGPRIAMSGRRTENRLRVQMHQAKRLDQTAAFRAPMPAP